MFIWPSFFNITDVYCAKKRVEHACICPTMVTGLPVLKLYPPPKVGSSAARKWKFKFREEILICWYFSKISGQNRVFSYTFSPEILSLRFRLSRTTSDPTRLIRTRPDRLLFAIGDPNNSRWRFSWFKFLPIFLFEHRQKNVFVTSLVFYLVTIDTQKEAHSRIFVRA